MLIEFTKNAFYSFSVLVEVVGTIIVEITEAPMETQIMEIQITAIESESLKRFQNVPNFSQLCIHICILHI